MLMAVVNVEVAGKAALDLVVQSEKQDLAVSALRSRDLPALVTVVRIRGAEPVDLGRAVLVFPAIH